MKLLTFAVPALLAASVSARSTFFSSSDVTSAQEQYKVPGENPLEHCDDPADDILIIKSVDLSPNPPVAYDCPLCVSRCLANRVLTIQTVAKHSP